MDWFIKFRLWLASTIVGKYTLIQNVDLIRNDYIIFIDHGRIFKVKNAKVYDNRSMIRYRPKTTGIKI